MLVLDEGAMFRVLLAASAVPPAEFETWLADIVARLEQVKPPAPSAGARYTREWRARERAGRCLLRLEVDEAALVVTLVDRGLLDASKADSRAALSRAAERALAQLGEVSPPAGANLDSLRLSLALQARETPWTTSENPQLRKR
jgi:hypothetical protein